MANVEHQERVARFVQTPMSPRHVGRRNLETAFTQIATLITSRDQSDVNSGMDSLYVLTRFLEKNTWAFDHAPITEVMQCPPSE